MIYDVIIIGGGPAGLMAANVLESHHINYLLIEKNERVGKKILLTGGKRCNVTNHLLVPDFIDALHMKHKRFLYHALKSFGPQDVVAFFKSKGLNLLLEQGFKYFPETGKSQSVVDALTQSINPQHMILSSAVQKISFNQSIFHVSTVKSDFQSRFLLLSTGSNAYPTIGSSGDGLKFATHLGIPYKPFTPAETSIYSSDAVSLFKDLQGFSLDDVKVTVPSLKASYKESILFTHFGLSGPVILHMSELIHHAIEKGDHKIIISFIDQSEDALKLFFESHKKERLSNILQVLLPKKMAQKLLLISGLKDLNISEISKKDMALIIDLLIRFPLKIDHVESIEKAFVNAGGIITDGINPKTMATKKIPQLYVAGELTDLQGPIGGFNITIALSTGRLAAYSMVEALSKQ